MSDYKTLRTWAMFLMVLGVVSVVSAGIGVLSLAIAVEGFWDTVGVIFLGTPIALLLASWPFAFGQALGALADIGDASPSGGRVRAKGDPHQRFVRWPPWMTRLPPATESLDQEPPC